MRTVLSLMVAGFIALFGFNTAMSAQLPAELTAEIQSLNTELTALQTAEKTLFAEQATLKAEEKRLIGVKELLGGAVRNFSAEAETYKNDQREHNADAANQRAEFARGNAAVAAHNSRCSGTFKDESYVNSCNAQANQLNAHTRNVLKPWANRVNARKRQLDDQYQTLTMKRQGLKDRYADLTRGTLDWTRRKKENNWQLNELEARRHSIQTRLRAIWDSAAVRDLERRNKLNQECRQLAESADPNNIMDTRLEQAHYCLQRGWDGAK